MPGGARHKGPGIPGELETTYGELALADCSLGPLGVGDRIEPKGAELATGGRLLDGWRNELPNTREDEIPGVLNDEDEFLAFIVEEKARELADACLNSDM